ncbi:MAG: 4Fe-4S dicluster domain-containing protein [Gammaproteobacteria bacterium]|nr:4Fe-4S dicluster domain-containing protein [Gammaproteobacteria bacterium]
MKCQVCLPHCPTYRLKGEEGDSPRGRIALIEALAEGTLEADPAVTGHLDGCLTCRACEAVCPADVPYGRLIDGARNELGARKPGGWRQGLLQFATRHPRLLGAMLRALRHPARLLFTRRSRLRPYVEALGPAPKLAAGPVDGEPLALFLGCIARAADTETLASSAALLASAGYRIEVPARQTCCGALAHHGGERRHAARLARRNTRAFNSQERIVATASGCTAHLSEYDAVFGDDAGFSAKVRDVTEVLADALESGRLEIRNDKPLDIALHTPCTQRNILRSDALDRALAQIPNVAVTRLPMGCCGAAGSYFLDRPADAEHLREPLVEAIQSARFDCVVTANIGCRLHLAAGLTGDGTTEVVHLASFLARLLHKATNATIP